MKTEWVHKKLGDDDVAKIIMGQSPSSASYNDENIGLPFLQGCADFGEVFPKTSVYCNEPLKVAPQNSIFPLELLIKQIKNTLSGEACALLFL